VEERYLSLRDGGLKYEQLAPPKLGQAQADRRRAGVARRSDHFYEGLW
jgi:hypothetical protein